ncbi:MAG: ParB/RepB/Spo0J family partition protein [Firmicutes bacterium]|jgi:ParB family chromosome partitioning protein|nr:ParB/RepB/Spo0J family partition protein [Bacillota bacterium]
MASKTTGLGRGLSALIPNQTAGGSTSVLREVPITSIYPNPYQPRKSFDEESLAELSDSIKALGLLQPVLVRETEPGNFELIAGERRWRASKRAGLQTIPVLVQSADDKLSLEKALVENLHRSDLNPIEEGSAYRQLIEEFGLTHEELAIRVGKSRAAVSNILRLLQLPPIIQVMLQEGSLTSGHAKVLLATPDRQIQERLAKEAVELKLSVRSLEEAVRRLTTTADESELPGAAGSQALIQNRADLENTAVTNPFNTEAQRLGNVTSKQLRPPGFLELEDLLSEHLDTRVKVEMGSKHGKIVIDFATLEDLERIYKAMVGRS